MPPSFMFWRRWWHPTPVLLPGKSHGWRSLVGCKELDTTERLHFDFSLSCIGEGNGNPLQCPCLENPRDGGAWWAAVYGVSQSRTQLKRLSSSSTSSMLGFPGGASGKEPACQCRRCNRCRFDPWGQEDPLEEEIAAHFCILAWKIPWTEQPGGLHPLGSQRTGQDWEHTDRQKVKLLSRVWLCDPMDHSPPGSFVHGTFQARVLEWIAISFSRGSSRLRDRTQVSSIVDRRFTLWATREVQTDRRDHKPDQKKNLLVNPHDWKITAKIAVALSHSVWGWFVCHHRQLKQKCKHITSNNWL